MKDYFAYLKGFEIGFKDQYNRSLCVGDTVSITQRFFDHAITIYGRITAEEINNKPVYYIHLMHTLYLPKILGSDSGYLSYKKVYLSDDGIKNKQVLIIANNNILLSSKIDDEDNDYEYCKKLEKCKRLHELYLYLQKLNYLPDSIKNQLSFNYTTKVDFNDNDCIYFFQSYFSRIILSIDNKKIENIFHGEITFKNININGTSKNFLVKWHFDNLCLNIAIS